MDEDLIESNNPRIKESFINSKDLETLDIILKALRKEQADYRIYLDRYLELLGDSKEEQIAYLKSIIKDFNASYCRIELEKLEDYQDFNIFIELIKNEKLASGMLFIIDNIKSPKIKQEVEEYIYREMDKIYDMPNYLEEKKQNPFYKLTTDYDSNNDNRFAAYYISKGNIISTSTITTIITKYGRNKLDWANILSYTKFNLSDEEINIFCEYYENKLKNEGVTLEEQMERYLFSKEGILDAIELICYLANNKHLF